MYVCIIIEGVPNIQPPTPHPKPEFRTKPVFRVNIMYVREIVLNINPNFCKENQKSDYKLITQTSYNSFGKTFCQKKSLIVNSSSRNVAPFMFC